MSTVACACLFPAVCGVSSELDVLEGRCVPALLHGLVQHGSLYQPAHAQHLDVALIVFLSGGVGVGGLQSSKALVFKRI